MVACFGHRVDGALEIVNDRRPRDRNGESHRVASAPGFASTLSLPWIVAQACRAHSKWSPAMVVETTDSHTVKATREVRFKIYGSQKMQDTQYMIQTDLISSWTSITRVAVLNMMLITLQREVFANRNYFQGDRMI